MQPLIQHIGTHDDDVVANNNTECGSDTLPSGDTEQYSRDSDALIASTAM